MNDDKAGSSRYWFAVLGVVLACVVLVGNIARAQQSAAPMTAGAKSAQTPTTGATATTVPEMKYEAGKLSLKADKADLVALLKKISLAAGVPIEIGMGVSATVTVEFVGLNLEEGVNRILAAAGENNFATEYTNKPGQKKDEYKIDKIVVVRKGASSPVAPLIVEKVTEAQIKAAMQKREQEYRDLFEKMDKEHNKIARALKEYTDPKTSKDKKTKLRTYLRQTSIDDPEDKKLLKGVSLDPKYAPLLGDIHMALLHAIQQHPEESDKEFLLDLLRKKIPPGWLMYTMLKVWDERYVPFLLDYAKMGGDVSIEILGRQKVTAAVPVLEQVLKDESISRTVRGTALDSLWLITGKRYEIEK